MEWGLAHRQYARWALMRSVGVEASGQTLSDGSLPNRQRLPATTLGGQRRTQATLKRGLAALGPNVVRGLRFVCTAMWKPYLGVIAEQASPALHVLDRFHITMHVYQAVDRVRQGESTRLRATGEERTAQAHVVALWQASTRSSPTKAAGVVIQQAGHGAGLGAKETLQHLWTYKSLLWARTFLDYWCCRAMHSRLEPMKKVARMLRAHEELLMNWFRAKGEISSGAVEGLNNKIRVVTRRSYGLRTYRAMEIGLYHTLGRLPEPPGPTDSAEEAT